MPEPREVTSLAPPPLWPETLPAPQADSMQIIGPPRVEYSDTLSGPTRTRVIARTAPMQWLFSCWFTAEQMEAFEAWYRACVEHSDGEFYARWIGGGRVVAFSAPYSYSIRGLYWILSGTVIRTRIDHTLCDAFLDLIFGAIYRDDGSSSDVYADDEFTAADSYVDDFDLQLIADSEC